MLCECGHKLRDHPKRLGWYCMIAFCTCKKFVEMVDDAKPVE